jgi:hypothetical protein
MRPSGALIAVLLLAALQACAMLQPPAGLDPLGRRVLHAIAAGDSAALSQIADASMPTSAADDDYRAVALTLTAWAPDSIALVGWNVNVIGETRNARLVYELHGRQGWGLATLNFGGRADGYRLVGLNLTPAAGPLASLNAFRLRSRSPAHYLVLFGTLASVVFTLASAILVWRTPMPRRRLLALLALVSFGSVALNWTTGQWGVQPVNLLLFGGAVARPGLVGPWVLTCGLPLGACIALWRRAGYRRQVAEERMADSAAAAAV